MNCSPEIPRKTRRLVILDLQWLSEDRIGDRGESLRKNDRGIQMLMENVDLRFTKGYFY